MRQIQSSDAKARFAELLDDVERGETIIITRRGRPIARIVPQSEGGRQRVDEALRAIEELRKTTGRITVEELRSARDEGRS